MPAAVEIVPAAAPMRVKQSIGEMPKMTSNPTAAPATQSAPAAPSAPPPPAKTPGLPSQVKPQSAPPVPPPVKPAITPIEPAPRKVAREMFEKLRNRNAPSEPAAPAEPAKPAETAKEVDVPMPGEHLDDPDLPEAREVDEKGKPKVNAWKLVKEYKAKAKELESQILEAKKLIKDEATVKLEAERLTKAEQRAKDFEDEIRRVNYQKHPEFQEKYEKPYINAVKKAMTSLSGITADTDTGTREITVQDVMDLVNAPTMRAASDRAKELFGEYSGDVMLQRNSIREAWDARVEALGRVDQEAREFEQRTIQQQQERMQGISTFAQEQWSKMIESSQADPENGEFFKPADGDEERNGLLTKGYELVDTGARENPLNPELSPEQRASVLKKHVAIRNRAAAYGVVKLLLKKARAEADELKSKLAQYEQSVPTTGGTAPTSTATSAPARATDQVFAELRRLAK